MYNDLSEPYISADELIILFSQLTEEDKQKVRDFIYSINSSSKHEPFHGLPTSEN